MSLGVRYMWEGQWLGKIIEQERLRAGASRRVEHLTAWFVEWKRPSVEHYLWCRITLIALGTRIWLALCSHFSLERSFAFLSDPCETVKLSSCPLRFLSALKMGHTCVCLRSPVGSHFLEVFEQFSGGNLFPHCIICTLGIPFISQG